MNIVQNTFKLVIGMTHCIPTDTSQAEILELNTAYSCLLLAPLSCESKYFSYYYLVLHLRNYILLITKELKRFFSNVVRFRCTLLRDRVFLLFTIIGNRFLCESAK